MKPLSFAARGIAGAGIASAVTRSKGLLALLRRSVGLGLRSHPALHPTLNPVVPNGSPLHPSQRRYLDSVGGRK